jgi:phage terminase large subunit-like protein
MRWYTNNVYVLTDGKGNKSYLKIEPIKRKTDGFFCFLHAMSKDEDLVEAGEFQITMSTHINLREVNKWDYGIGF